MFAKSICDHFDRKSNFFGPLTKLSQIDTQPSKDFIFTGKKETKKPKGLFFVGVSLLQVHGLIQKEKIAASINPSCKHNFVNVNLAKNCKLQQNKWSTQVNNEKVQVYKDLKLYMDKYVLHCDFYISDMDNMDVVLGYPWMESVGTVNINVHNFFMKLWYKKKKIALQDISIKTQAETMEAKAHSNDTETSVDEPLMVDIQTQTSNEVPEKQRESKEAEAENVTGTVT